MGTTINTDRQWNVNISIIKNPLLWFQMIMVNLLSAIFLLLLLVGLNLFENQWQEIPTSILIAALVGGGIFLFMSSVLFLMYWQGVPTKYVLHNDNIEQHTLSRGKKLRGFLSLLGLLSGKSAGFTAAGANALAYSREIIAVEWKDTTALEVYPERNEIQLHNEWRTIMQIVCPEDQFDNIVDIIKDKTKDYIQPVKKLEIAETSFARKVILSLLCLIFGIFLFPRLPIHYVGIFTIATVIIALLSLWSDGFKQRIFGGILFFLPLIGVVLAYINGEVEMYRSGAIYALMIELVILGFFVFLGLGVVLNRFK